MDNKNTPAFPVNEETTDRIDAGTKIYTGLSKREYFAAMAMQGLLAGRWANKERFDCSPETIATFAVNHADQLLNELSTPQP